MSVAAFGPGGVRARVLRHFRRTNSRHWHIDYLREILNPVGAWYSHDANRLEHRWAQVLSNMSGLSPIKGFGCSDYTCYSHLFKTPTAPDFNQFLTIAGGKTEAILTLQLGSVERLPLENPLPEIV